MAGTRSLPCDEAAAYISTEFNIPVADAKRFIGYIDFTQVNLDEPARNELRNALTHYVKLKGLPKARDFSPNITTEFIDAVKLRCGCSPWSCRGFARLGAETRRECRIVRLPWE